MSCYMIGIHYPREMTYSLEDGRYIKEFVWDDNSDEHIEIYHRKPEKIVLKDGKTLLVYHGCDNKWYGCLDV